MKMRLVLDKHDFLDPEIACRLARVNHILHAGDVGRKAILGALEEITPVKAVMGNPDYFSNAPSAETITLGGRECVFHRDGNPCARMEELKLRIAPGRPDPVGFSHTHRRWCKSINGAPGANPGCAGKTKFNAGSSVAT